MPDVLTKAKRSQVMSRIRGRGNKESDPALVKLLRAAHHRLADAGSNHPWSEPR